MKITKGKWRAEEHDVVDEKGMLIAVGYRGLGSEEDIANAKAIVTAVNNTYGQRINPEAVPEMKRALEEIEENLIHAMKKGIIPVHGFDYLHKKAKTALKDAEIR